MKTDFLGGIYMAVHSYKGINPAISGEAKVFPSATVCGDVKIGKGSSVWFGAVVRGDMAGITIGRNTNIQDNAIVHTSIDHPTVIGNNVTIGHGAIIHGCTIGDNALIGMGAVVLVGAVIGKNAMVAAMALVPQGKAVPEGMLALGVPIFVKRSLTQEEIETNTENSLKYMKMAKEYE